MKTALILFNRDLRVHDNPALAAAARAERTVPLFVLDEQLLGSRFAAPNRVAFMREALADLDESLRKAGGRLFLRRGDPVREALALARECGAAELHVSADYSAYARARERRLAAACEEERIAFHAPSRGDDRAARRGHPHRRRPLQGLHALPPRLERGAGAPAARAAAQALACRRISRVGRLPALEKLSAGAPSPERAARRRERGTQAGRRLPAQRRRRIRRAARRPPRRRHLAAQRPPPLRLRLAAGAEGEGAPSGAAARLRAPALLARLPPPGPRRHPLPPPARLPPPRRPLVALAAGARGLAAGPHRLPAGRCRRCASWPPRASCTTGPG